MSVPSVPYRSRQHFGTRSDCCSHRSLPLRGGGGNADLVSSQLVKLDTKFEQK